MMTDIQFEPFLSNATDIFFNLFFNRSFQAFGLNVCKECIYVINTPLISKAIALDSFAVKLYGNCSREII